MVAHGGGRFTKDIDFLIDDDPATVARVTAALGVLADNAAADVANTDIQTYTVVRIADEVLIDLMGRACGLTSRMSRGRRHARAGRGASAPFAC